MYRQTLHKLSRIVQARPVQSLSNAVKPVDAVSEAIVKEERTPKEPTPINKNFDRVK